MYQPLPDFPPLYPGGEWWRLYMRERLGGKERKDALRNANLASGIRAREWMRFRISGDTAITLPVAGGAATLKNAHPSTWTTALNEYRRECRKAGMTLATAYGRTPFFHLIKDDIISAIEGKNDAEEGPRSVEDVCNSSFDTIRKILGLEEDSLIEQLRTGLENKEPTFKQVCEESKKDIDLELSIIDTISRLGRDAIFALLPTF